MKTYYFLKNHNFLATLVLVLFTAPLFSQTTYNISDPEDLESQTYVAGDEIILADGTYNTDERITFVGNGTAANPIIFRAETPGGVKFTGGMAMNIGGDYVVVDGFYWKGGIGSSNFIQFRDGEDYANHSTIQNCAIDGLTISSDDASEDAANNSITKHRWIVLYGTYNTVINCSFLNKTNAGALVLAEYEFNAEDDRCKEVGHVISNNYFYKYSKMDSSLSNSGDSETIRIGTSEYQNVNSNAIVSNNYFVEADGEVEIITNKSANNLYQNNTFRRCRGSLVLRHGSKATVEGNIFLGENVEGTAGIRIVDSEHTIMNNYIQDCVTLVNDPKWNNGITFLGGGDSHNVDCSSTSVSNGYQKVENITIYNNTIINTNAPLFYNLDKGSNDPTGSVTDNLVYFESGNSNLTDVISGGSSSAYTELGTTLNYSGNVYNGTELGATNTGFSEETGITATADGEIFTFSGNGSKGADLGSYTPTTDDMVGNEIGACFLDNVGALISGGDCTVDTDDTSGSLVVSSLPSFAAIASSDDVSVTANVSWTAVSNDSWITINPSSGSGNATVSVDVDENTETTSRTGTVTFTEDAGGDDIERTLTVTQEGADAEELNVSSLSTFTATASSDDVSVTATVSWSAVSNDSWITISPNSGTGNATVSVDVDENTETTSRTGTVTFTEDAGGNDIERTLTVTQEGAEPEELNASSLSTFAATASSDDVSVTATVSWSAVSSDSWITINPNSGTGNATVSVGVDENTETTTRTGTVTFTEDAGGDDLVSTVTVTQEGVDLTDLYDLINTGTGLSTDKVTVHSFSNEEVNGVDKFNYAANTLDKIDDTVWVADDNDIVTGDYKGDGEYIIYDLGSSYSLNLIQLLTNSKSDAYGFQIAVSTTGTDASDFSIILPTSGDLLLTETNSTDFNQYEVNSEEARYIKLIGYGRFNSDGDTRTSVWSTVGEIEFYGSESSTTGNLTISSLPDFNAETSSEDISVSATVSWTAVSNDSWITINPNSGTGDETVSVTVTENTETTSRIGTVTFTENAGGDDIVRTLTVTQLGVGASELTISNLPDFNSEESSEDISVSATVSWTAVSNDSWIIINPNSGTGDATVSVTVTENTETTSRTGTVTFTEDAGGDDIVRTLNVSQEGADLTDLYDLINVGTGLASDKVTVYFFSKEEVNDVDKFNYAANTLDKDNETVWAAFDESISDDDYKGDGEYIIYDLGSNHNIDLIQFTTTDESDAFGFQIEVSTTDTNDSDFSMILPNSGDLILTATNTTDFNQYEVNSIEARYIKITGFGRFNDAGDALTSIWSTIGEIEFYGSEIESDVASTTLIYPVPATEVLYVQNLSGVDMISIYSLDGRKIMHQNLSEESAIEINLTEYLISSGSYIIVFRGDDVYESKSFTISD